MNLSPTSFGGQAPNERPPAPRIAAVNMEFMGASQGFDKGRRTDQVASGRVLISLVTVVYNDADGLRRTADSLPSAFAGVVEWLIVDGNSTDGTNELLEELGRRPYVRVLRRPPNGIYDAMNVAVSNARGNWCWFLNAGDILLEDDSLNQAVDLIERHRETALIGTPVLYFTHGGYVFSVATPALPSEDLRDLGNFHHQGALMRTSAIKEMGGFRTDLRLASDGALLDLIASNFATAVEFHPLVGFFFGGASTSQQLEALRETNSFRPKFYTGGTIATLRTKNIGIRILLTWEGSRLLGPLVRRYLSLRESRVRSSYLMSVTSGGGARGPLAKPNFFDQCRVMPSGEPRWHE